MEIKKHYVRICFEGEELYIELDEQEYAIRQLNIDEHSGMHLSCREDCLAEGVICETDIEGQFQYISRELFEEKWSLAMLPYKSVWIQTKRNYLIGSKVIGKSVYNYPQGTIICGRDFWAIYIGKQNIQIDQNVRAKVAAYDEENMWLVLE